jgi:hypothetical protein
MVLRLHLHDVVVLGKDVLRGGTQTGVDLNMCSVVGNSVLWHRDLVEVEGTWQQTIGPSLEVVVHVTRHACMSRITHQRETDSTQAATEVSTPTSSKA